MLFVLELFDLPSYVTNVQFTHGEVTAQNLAVNEDGRLQCNI